MTSRSFWGYSGVMCAICALLTVALFAADEIPAAAPTMTPEQQAMMAEMERLAKPGPEHAALAVYVGDFNADVTMWMDPAQPPMKSSGKLHNEMTFGGRHLMGTYEGEMMGMPFHGMSMTGYDNGMKKYVNSWIDDMSTAMMVAQGEADATGKIISLAGEVYCPQVKGMLTARQILKMVDKDTMQMEMYGPGPDGKEMKMMEITYTRVK